MASNLVNLGLSVCPKTPLNVEFAREEAETAIAASLLGKLRHGDSWCLLKEHGVEAEAARGCFCRGRGWLRVLLCRRRVTKTSLPCRFSPFPLSFSPGGAGGGKCPRTPGGWEMHRQ